MAVEDRPSWIADTLSGELPDPLTEELAGLSADLDHLEALLRRYEQESDRPPPDDPPASALAA